MSQNPYENNPYDKNPGNGQNQQPQGYQPQNQNPYEQQGAQYQQDPYGQPQPGAVSADDKNMAFLMNLISTGSRRKRPVVPLTLTSPCGLSARRRGFWHLLPSVF